MAYVTTYATLSHLYDDELSDNFIIGQGTTSRHRNNVKVSVKLLRTIYLLTTTYIIALCKENSKSTFRRACASAST